MTRDGGDIAEYSFAVAIVRVHWSAIGILFEVLMGRNLFCVLSTDSEEAFWADL